MDVFTLLVTVTAVSLLVTTVMIFLSYTYADRAMARGASALVAFALGLSAIAFRGQIGEAISIIVGNALIGAGFVLLTQAALIYQDRKGSPWLLWVPVCILLLALTSLLEDSYTRAILTSIVYFAQAAILLLLIVVGRQKTPGIGWKIFLAAVGSFSAVMALRAVAIINDEQLFQGIFVENWVQSLTYMISLAGIVLVALGFVSMSLEHGTRQLRATERKFKTYIEQANDVVYTLNVQGEFEYLSPNVETWLGNPPEFFIGKHYSKIIHPDDLDRCNEFFNAVAQTRQPKAGLEYRVKHGDGSWRWHDSNATPILDNSGNFQFFLGIGRDIHERKLDKERLDQLAYYDNLTGLPNRVLIRDRFQNAASLAQRNNTNVAILFLDMNNFKQINDNFGHKVGDMALQEATQRMQSALRSSDSLGRLGGDEFVIVLPNVKDRISAEHVLAKVEHAISQPLEIQGAPILLDCAIGLALFPEQGDEFDTLIREADTAMYHIKRTQRHRAEQPVFQEGSIINSPPQDAS